MAASPIPGFQGFEEPPVVEFKEDKAELAAIISELTGSDTPDPVRTDLATRKVEVLMVDPDEAGTDLPTDEMSLSIVLNKDLAPPADSEDLKLTEDGFVMVPRDVKPGEAPKSVYTIKSMAYSGANLVVKVVRNRTVQDTALIAGTFLFTGPIPGSFMLAGKCVPAIAKTIIWTFIPWPMRTALKTAEVCHRNKILFNGGLIAWTFMTRGFVAGSLATAKEVSYRWIAARVAQLAALFL